MSQVSQSAQQPAAPPAGVTSSRVTVDLSPQLFASLEHIAAVTGMTKSSVLSSAFIEALPSIMERIDFVAKRAAEIRSRQQQVKK